MSDNSKIPIVVADSIITGRSYSDSLKSYNSMTAEQQRSMEDMYLDNNMGYGKEAWSAYCEAKRARGETW